MFSVPFAKQGDLQYFFEWIEKDAQNGDSKMVRDFGCSYTTLEEVYLKITHEANFGFGEGQASNSIANTVMQGQQYH
jgi:hypothetical protein